MKSFHVLKGKTVVVFIVIFSITIPWATFAIADPLDLYFAPSYTMANDNFNYQVALNSNDSTVDLGADVNESSTTSGSFNFGALHKYSGYATLLFAVAAGLTGSDGDSFHKSMGHCTTAFATLTATSGLIEYADDIKMKDGFTFVNLHALLGSLATVGFIANTASADDDGHSGIPIGSAAMAFGGAILIHF